MYVPSTGFLARFLVAINSTPGQIDWEIVEQLSSRCYDRLEGNEKFERLGYPKNITSLWKEVQEAHQVSASNHLKKCNVIPHLSGEGC